MLSPTPHPPSRLRFWGYLKYFPSALTQRQINGQLTHYWATYHIPKELGSYSKRTLKALVGCKCWQSSSRDVPPWRNDPRIEPLSREEYLDQIHKHILLAAETGIDLIIMHPLRLSLFFIICSIATLFDTEVADPVAAAEEWHHLSKAAASLGSLMDEPSIVGTKTTVSCLILRTW
jgi:hypothetical protein